MRTIVSVDCLSGEGLSWFHVHRQCILGLGLAGSISKESRQDGNWVYMEESRDYPEFCEACLWHGASLRVRYRRDGNPSRILSMQPFQATGQELGLGEGK